MSHKTVAKLLSQEKMLISR